MKSKILGGIGLCELLAVLFIGLKLAGLIDWSWWLVLSPILVPWALAGLLAWFINR
jgi:hypothetical protein